MSNNKNVNDRYVTWTRTCTWFARDVFVLGHVQVQTSIQRFIYFLLRYDWENEEINKYRWLSELYLYGPSKANRHRPHIQVFGRVLSAHFKGGISLAFNVIISQAWISSYKEEHFNRVDRLRAHEERLCTWRASGWRTSPIRGPLKETFLLV